MRAVKLGSVALAALAFPATMESQGARSTTAAASPARLVVFLTIDAMRADYYDRFKRDLTGGLAMLYRDGAVFTNGFQDHAIAETAPGHASTMSGRFPVHTGIATNIAGVGDSMAFLVDAGGPGASPFRFQGTTLTDWLLAKDRRTKVLSVSRKDRGAILPVGRSKQQVFWYAPNGLFTTSSYYSDTLPAWVQRFNARKLPASYAGRSWKLLLSSDRYSEPDSVPVENGGNSFVFPHALPGDPRIASQILPNFPWMDEVTLQLALSGVAALNLGDGPATDILAISLSTTDAVGHQYGPDSREVHDQIVRLDRSLGMFFDSLFKIRSKKDVVIALTSDHGMTPYPEVRGYDRNANARRVNVRPVVEAFRAELKRRGVKSEGISFDNGVVMLDEAQMRAAGVGVDSFVSALRAEILKVPGVMRADRIGDLRKQDTTRDAIARRWLHMFDENSGVALVVTADPYSYWVVSPWAQHGAPHHTDTHVPILFYGAPFRPGRYAEFARVVDMAPTLASVLHVKPLEKLDGRSLTRAIR